MPAPLFALFFLTEPEAFLLCLPFLGGPAGLSLQTNGLPLTARASWALVPSPFGWVALAASRCIRFGLAKAGRGAVSGKTGPKGSRGHSLWSHWYNWASVGSAPKTTRAAW